MESIFVKAGDATLEKIENEVAAVLIHKTELLRFKNWLRSPLLRLPAEIVTHILSDIMEDIDHPYDWRQVFTTCHRIHTIMCTSSELWWKADFVLDKGAHLAFARSMGNLQEITADFRTFGDWQEGHTQNAVDFCSQNMVLYGHKLHTVNICGLPSDVVHWSWIFERHLPRLHHLKIHFFAPVGGRGSLSDPVVLELPTDLPLWVLDIRNAMLPWSSNLFTGLSELCLDFSDCDALVEISEDELLGIFDASPQLERLSLTDLTPSNPVAAPTRTVQLPSLTFLRLDDVPQFIGYILSHMNIPAIASLDVHFQLSFWEVEESLDAIFPDDRLPNRLFPNPPVFEVRPERVGGAYDSLKVKIGSAKIQFDCDTDDAETSFTEIMSCVHSLVPASATTLRLDYSGLDEGEWVEFFGLHPGVRSIFFFFFFFLVEPCGGATHVQTGCTACPVGLGRRGSHPTGGE